MLLLAGDFRLVGLLLFDGLVILFIVAYDLVW